MNIHQDDYEWTEIEPSNGRAVIDRLEEAEFLRGSFAIERTGNGVKMISFSVGTDLPYLATRGRDERQEKIVFFATGGARSWFIATAHVDFIEGG